jgi:hypothetical protein
VPQVGHCKIFFTPLIGMIGMMKNRVMNRIPFLTRNGTTEPQLPQCIAELVRSEPQTKKCVPMMKNIILSFVLCSWLLNDTQKPLQNSKNKEQRTKNKGQRTKLYPIISSNACNGL